MPDERVSAALRQMVTERAHGCCEYCRSQQRFAMQAFSVEHVAPRSRQGATALDNLALACQGCNNFKYTKTEGVDSATGRTVPLFHPRLHRWSDHFAWNEDFTQIIGLTATGRATVNTLQLNRIRVVNLRRLLTVEGLHPPLEE